VTGPTTPASATLGGGGGVTAAGHGPVHATLGGVGAARVFVPTAPTRPAPPPASYAPPPTPAYAATPVRQPWHVWWNGLLLGWSAPVPGMPQVNTSQWSLTDLDGWLSLPDSDLRNTDRQARWGAFAGLQTFGTRTIEATFTYTGYGDKDVLREVRKALTPQENPLEQRLWIWAGTSRPEFCMARVDKAAIPSDLEFSLGYHRITVSWVASDPVRYGETEQSGEARLAPSSGGGGLHFGDRPGHLRFPLDFGDTTTTGAILAVNNEGLLDVWPTLEVHGPITGPIIEHLPPTTSTTTGTPARRRLVFAPTMSIARGKVLHIDTNNRYASQDGTSRAHLMTTREWFTLPTGFSRVRFSGTDHDPDAKLVVTWRTAAII
jgi:hypothetical protein